MLSFLSPTKDQLISFLGTVFKWAGSALVARGYTVSPDITALFTGPEALQFYAGILMAVLPVLRDKYVHSDAGKLASASTLATGPNPVIKQIEVLPAAPAPIQALVPDKDVPGVKAAAPPPPYTPPRGRTNDALPRG